MNKPEMNKEIWIALRQKWTALDAEGHAVKVEFNILKDPKDESGDLAIDVAQSIDGEWVVQTVQRQPKEAYPVIGIEGLSLDQLTDLASQAVNSVTEPITGMGTCDDEMHLFMKRISAETSEVYGYIISEAGQKIGIRSNYQHYYVLNEILEQKAKMMQEEYSEIQVHREKGDHGKIHFRFIPA
jgi:flavoprotein